MTKEQHHTICLALALGHYFVEGQAPTGEQYETDKQAMADAWQLMEQLRRDYDHA